jgi:hypothetical protein
MPRIVTVAVSNRLNPSIGRDALLYPAMICAMIPALFKLRIILLHPPKNSRIGQSDATFRHHLDEIAGAELKRQIPPDAQDDDFLVKVPPFEETLCRGRFRHPSRYRQTPRVSTVCTRARWVTYRSQTTHSILPSLTMC